MNATRQPKTVVHVEGGGGARCGDCGSTLYLSWRVRYEDGRTGNLCSTCLEKHPRQP